MKYKSILQYLVVIITINCLFIGCSNNKSTTIDTNKSADSTSIYLKQVKNASIFDEKSKLLQKAYIFANKEHDDSVKNHNLSKIAFSAYKTEDTTLFKIVNSESLELSKALRDSLKIGDAHWNFGLHYNKKEVLDSAYFHFYKANINFKATNHDFFSAKMHYNMAFIEGRYEDYISAESNLFKAIEKYKSLDKNLSLHKSYKLLASVYEDIEDYDAVYLFYEKARQSLLKTKDTNFYKEKLLISTALAHEKQSQHNKAICNFKEALKTKEIKEKDPKLYMRILENLNHTKLLTGDTLGLKNEFLRFLDLKKVKNNRGGIATTYIHLSKYDAFKTDTLSAINYAKRAYNISRNHKYTTVTLKSLLLLSKIEKDSASIHLSRYLELKENLIKQQRKFKNEFARVRYHTNDYIDKAEQLNTQKTRLIIFIVASSIIFFLLYSISVQRSKNKQLLLKQEQQKANEEIYQLMLSQQSKLEEGRIKERYRISEELHDGILGKIFGARMGLGFLDLKSKDKEAQNKFNQYIDDFQSIEEEIRQVSHDLKNEILSSNMDYILLLENLVKDKSEIGGFDYNIVKNGSSLWNEAKDIIKVNIYRIVQELLQNILKHANANKVIIEFNAEEDFLYLTLIDNGIGFSLKKVQKGIGHKNIRSRLQTINGQLNIRSTINEGTTIDIKIPI